MKEIKFRAWDKRNNKWIHPDLFFITNHGFYEDFRELEDGNSLFDYEYDLMQYTGLKDKNGQEIYEGDILAVDYFSNVNPNDYDDDDYFDDEPKIKVVKWAKNGYGIEEYKSVVIGNIYENK